MRMEATARYGVRLANEARDPLDEAAETLRLLGYAVVDAGLSDAELEALRERFRALYEAEDRGARGALRRAAGEAELLRCPLARDPAFLALASNPRILALCEALIGPGFLLNQQNGVVNPAGAATYSQSPFHRDLPYQHFVSTRPLALNALFCLDPFTEENGATWVIPASHKEEAFPSEPVLRAQRRQVSAPAGSFLVLDCMLWHGGGVNRTAQDRRAVNHVYTIAMMRQQIDLPTYLGDDFTQDAKLRQLLGFQHPQPRSVEEYLTAQARKREAQARPR
jgi:ectoine hydroxylase-related dioxygenase (phytanoyl-CoA dioxygenase family)